MSTALIPGSYDPITLGHLDVITRTAARFDRVVVAVMTNDMRKYVQDALIKQYMFDQSERAAMAEAACAHLPNVEVISAGGMLIDLFDHADVAVKNAFACIIGEPRFGPHFPFQVIVVFDVHDLVPFAEHVIAHRDLFLPRLRGIQIFLQKLVHKVDAQRAFLRRCQNLYFTCRCFHISRQFIAHQSQDC